MSDIYSDLVFEHKVSFDPFHEHDCLTACTYLGSVNHIEYEPAIDLYFHRGCHETTLIARFGIDGDYSSGCPSKN